MNKRLTKFITIGLLTLAVASCGSANYTLSGKLDSTPVKTETKLTEALQCLGKQLENAHTNPGAYVFMVRDIIDGTVKSSYSDGPLADAGRIQMISILTAHTKPSYGLVTDEFPLMLTQTQNEQMGLNRFGLPSRENLHAYVSMLTNFTNVNRKSRGMSAINAVRPLVIDGAFTRYDSSHTRSKGYGKNAGYRGDDERNSSVDFGRSGSERSVTLVVNIVDPRTNVVVGTEGFDLKFYSKSKTARFRVAVDDFYYGFSNTDVQVETIHAAQQTLLEAGAIWILDNAFGNFVDFAPCFDTDEKLALGQDARFDRIKARRAALLAKTGDFDEPLTETTATTSPPESAQQDAQQQDAPSDTASTGLAEAEVNPEQLAAQQATEQAALKTARESKQAALAKQVETERAKAAQAKAAQAKVAPAKVAQAGAPNGVKQYQVKRKPKSPESLSKIASYDFVYGDASQWPRLYIANKDKLKNPDIIYPGQVIEIPSIKHLKKVNAAAAGSWQVSVGVFAKSKNVTSVADLLNSKGYKANYRTIKTSSGKATQVWLGPYAEKKIANKIGASLKGIVGEKGQVAKHTF